MPWGMAGEVINQKLAQKLTKSFATRKWWNAPEFYSVRAQDNEVIGWGYSCSFFFLAAANKFVWIKFLVLPRLMGIGFVEELFLDTSYFCLSNLSKNFILFWKKCSYIFRDDNLFNLRFQNTKTKCSPPVLCLSSR